MTLLQQLLGFVSCFVRQDSMQVKVAECPSFGKESQLQNQKKNI